MQVIEDPKTVGKEPTPLALFGTPSGSKYHLQASEELFVGPQSASGTLAINKH